MDVDVSSPFVLVTFSFVEYGCASKPVGRGDAIAISQRFMVWPKMAMMWIVTATSEVRRGRQTGTLGFAELPRKLRVFGVIMWLGESSLPRASQSEAIGLVGAIIGEAIAPSGG